MITISWQNVDTQQKRRENSEDPQEEKQKSITIICWDQLNTLDQQVEPEIETAPECKFANSILYHELKVK